MHFLFAVALCTSLLAPVSTIADPGSAPSLHGAPIAPQGRDGKPLKALDAWMKLYRKGKIDLRGKRGPGKHSLALKYHLRDGNALGDATWIGDLNLILEHVSRLDDAEAAEAITRVASVGLDQFNYAYTMAPYAVRRTAEKWIAKLSSAAAKDSLAVGARGEWKVARNLQIAVRAAALRGLGLVRDANYRDTLTAALADGSELIRIHAIDALAMIGDEQATQAIIGIVEREQSGSVLTTAAKALRTIYGDYVRDARSSESSANASEQSGADEAGKQSDDGSTVAAEKPAAPESARLAVRAAISALGRTTWRADMVLVRLLDDFRSAETVPALIAVLERFRDNPADVESGKLSGLLLFQAHELLVSMTGAVYPATEPDKWRELWEREKDSLEVTKPKSVGSSKTRASSFAGIPVQGTRVVFVLDLSGSMEWPMEDPDDPAKSKIARIDYAKRELHRAIDEISPNAFFNLVTFNGDSEAESWSKKLVQATPRNRERFKKSVSKLRPRGGTNLWSGLESALDIKSLEYGNRYDTSVDELFILSDGAPTVGEVIDPIEILRLIGECNRFADARINAVFISSATPPEMRRAQPNMSITPKELMKRLAEQNGGRFRDV